MESTMDECSGAGQQVNSFALVSYLPDPPAAFLNRVRVDLVPGCHAKSHVTVLPPRSLRCSFEDAWRDIKRELEDLEPFRIELGEVEVFRQTDVIYLTLRQGRRELDQMHTALNRGCLGFQEQFEYHPHVTLAQDLPLGSLPEALEAARQRWNEYRGPRQFMVDQLTFVQNTAGNRWKDLAGCLLSSHSNISS